MDEKIFLEQSVINLDEVQTEPQAVYLLLCVTKKKESATWHEVQRNKFLSVAS